MSRFFYKRSVKEVIVSWGTILFLVVLTTAAVMESFGGYIDEDGGGHIALVIGLILAAIVAAIFVGWRLGYGAGKCISFFCAVLLVAGGPNPFAWRDLHGPSAAFTWWAVACEVAGMAFVFFFWCLHQHARLRGLARSVKLNGQEEVVRQQ